MENSVYGLTYGALMFSSQKQMVYLGSLSFLVAYKV